MEILRYAEGFSSLIPQSTIYVWPRIYCIGSDRLWAPCSKKHQNQLGTFASSLWSGQETHWNPTSSETTIVIEGPTTTSKNCYQNQFLIKMSDQDVWSPHWYPPVLFSPAQELQHLAYTNLRKTEEGKGVWCKYFTVPHQLCTELVQSQNFCMDSVPGLLP